MSRVPPMKCKSHGIPECVECKKPKSHGPVSPHFMNHYYGASQPASASDDTALLRQALEAMETVAWHGGGSAWIVDAERISKAIADLRERLGEKT